MAEEREERPEEGPGEDAAAMDAELRAFLEGAREEEASAEDLRALLGETRGKIEAAEKSPLFWLRSRSTGARRGMALMAACAMVATSGLLMARGDLASYPSWRLALEAGALGLLLLGSVIVALRPLHRPEPPRWVSGLGAGLALLTTFAIAALAPSLPLHLEEGAALAAAPGCFLFGLLFGVPVYALLRILDRGPDTGAILAACAAGLAGNLALHLHCAMPVPEHMLAGHFSVAVLFVGGILLLRAVTRRAQVAD